MPDTPWSNRMEMEAKGQPCTYAERRYMALVDVLASDLVKALQFHPGRDDITLSSARRHAEAFRKP